MRRNSALSPAQLRNGEIRFARPIVSIAGRRIFAALLLALVGLAPGVTPGLAADKAQSSSEREAEFTVPRGAIVRRGQGQRVTVKDGDDEQVALLLAEVGPTRLVILPDGRIVSLRRDQAPVTSEPFQAATKKEIAAELMETDFRRFKTRSTARYVYVYNTSEEFLKGTRTILETMYPAILAYFKRQKFPVHEPNVPLVAIMFRTEAEFRKYAQMPPSVAAYYNTITNQIVMYEQSQLVEVAPDLAVKQSIGTIAHEGIHQILHNIGVQERLSRWPLWTGEGLAEYFAPTSVDKRLHWKGVGEPHDLRMHELERFLKQPSRESGKMVEETVMAARLTSTGYASAWALTHYLASRQKEKFHAYLREVARLGPLEPGEDVNVAQENKRLFTQFFGDNFAQIEDDLLKHLKGLPYIDPVANQTHYVIMLNGQTLRSARVTSSPAAVRKWQEETMANMTETARSQSNFQVLPFANRDLAEEYAKQWLHAR